jgi:ribonuclease Z
MKLVFLGTSAAQPTEKRGLSCICLEKEGEILMFDAGESAQISYMKSGLGWNKKMKLFVTHLHGDHCVGILGLLQTMSMQNRTEPLEIFGPKGIDEFLAANIKILNFGLPFSILITIVNEGTIYENNKFLIHAAKANHSITAFSYLFEEKDKPGRFNVEKAKELGIPEGELWNKLQNGIDVINNEKIIKPEQVLGKKRPGKKIGISGDTMPTKELEEFFNECDYLVFDSTFLDEEKQKAQDTCHSTAKQAAELGKKANVKNLILTHFSARYKDEIGHKTEAEQIHNSVITAKDLLEVEIN